MSPSCIQPTSGRLRAALAAALRDEPAHWPEGQEGAAWAEAMPGAILYHGVAGLLASRPLALRDWPANVTTDLLDQARAGAMWELRHRDVLGRLLTALAEQSVRALVMKGSALAYDVY